MKKKKPRPWPRESVQF